MCTHATRVAMYLHVVYLSGNACKENRRGEGDWPALSFASALGGSKG